MGHLIIINNLLSIIIKNNGLPFYFRAELRRADDLGVWELSFTGVNLDVWIMSLLENFFEKSRGFLRKAENVR